MSSSGAAKAIIRRTPGQILPERSFIPPRKKPKPRQKTTSHLDTHSGPSRKKVPASSKDVGPRDSYGENIVEAWTNSSGEENKSIETHTNPPINTQTLILYLTNKTGPATSRNVGPRVSHGQNSVDPWKNSSGEEMKVKTQGQPP